MKAQTKERSLADVLRQAHRELAKMPIEDQLKRLVNLGLLDADEVSKAITRLKKKDTKRQTVASR